MTIGLAVKAVAVATGIYDVGGSLPGLWASKNPNEINDLSMSDKSVWRSTNFLNRLSPFCTDLAYEMHCRNHSQIQLDVRIPAPDDNLWVTRPRGINLWFGKPLIAINRDMLPTARISADPNDLAQLQKHRVCQFFIAESLAHLNQNTNLLFTLSKVVVFVATVFFLSPTLLIASYPIALVLSLNISSALRLFANTRAITTAITSSSIEVRRAALAHFEAMKAEIDSITEEFKKASLEKGWYESLSIIDKLALDKRGKHARALHSEYPDLLLRIRKLKEALPQNP